MPSPRERRWSRASRAAIVVFVLGMAATLGLLFWTMARQSAGPTDSTVVTALGPMTFFTSVRSVTESGTTATLTYGWGLPVLLVALPVLAAALAWWRAGADDPRTENLQAAP